ncbi:hypothetical protein XaraCFBP7407_16230, partial [Xanthomonas arboricola pv. arracaciae]
MSPTACILRAWTDSASAGDPESKALTINTFIMQLGAHWRTLLPPAREGLINSPQMRDTTVSCRGL